MQEGMWRVLLGGYTHSVRQTDISVGVVGAAAVNLVRVAGLLNYHRARLHRILVYSIYTNTQGKKERERPEWGTSLTRRVFLSRPIKRKQVWQQWNKRERLTKLAGLQGEVYSPTNQRLCLHQSLHILAWQNKTDLGSDLLSCHALSWRDAACRKWNNRITLLCKLTMKSVTNPKPYLDHTNMPNERALSFTCY